MRTIRPTLYFIAALFAALLLVISAEIATAQDAPPSDYRRLRDLPVLVDERHGMWVGAGNGLAIKTDTVCQSPYMPISGEHNGLPAYHFLVTGSEEGGWWSALFAGKDWESYSLAPYYPNGALEFNIKGAFGGEDMKIAVQDIEFERAQQHINGADINVSSYISVTAEWQAVSIPILDLIPNGGTFNLNQIHGISINAASTKPLEMWISNMRWTSPALEPSSPAIKINQLGYTENGEKYAYVSGFEDELTARAGTPFEVREIGNNSLAYSGELDLVSAYDAGASGEYVLVADFSDLTAPGDYYIAVSAYRIDDSPPFAIGNGIYSELLVDASRYYYLQRQGIPLDPVFAGPFARGIGHVQDTQAQLRSGGDAILDVSQGWYDAGDYGKYVNAGAVTISDLLWAYELYPDQFTDSQLNIPEGGNGTPDLLDEIRWELEFLRKMQDANSGGFYHMVQETETLLPDEAQAPRYIEDVRLVSTVTEEEDPILAIVGCGETLVDGTNVRPSATTGSAVAALAHAAIVFQEVDPGYAERLLSSAEFGWQFLQANPTGVAPVDGPYKDDDDLDDRFWAAATLWRATGNTAYQDYIATVYQDVETHFLAEDENAYGVGKTGILGVLQYFSAENNDPAIQDWFAGQFNEWRSHMVQRNRDSVWQTTLLDEDYYWGSNNVALTTPLALAVGAKALGNYDDTLTALSQTALNYLLGVNPLRISYISGYGEDSVKNLHSQIWNLDGQPDIPPGVLAGGPNAYTDPLLYSNFPAKRYIDNPITWTVNEHTIYWNSALVFNAALIAAEVAQAPAAVEPTPAPTEPPIVVAQPTAAPVATEPPATGPEPTPFPLEPPPAQPTSSPLSAILLMGGIALFTALCVLGLVWAFFLRRE